MFNAIFLVGGPGSGKNILLDTITKHNFKEISLESLSVNLDKLSENYVVNTNAYNYDKVIGLNNILIENKYSTSMIYVDVSYDNSYSRVKDRLISEEAFNIKFNKSKNNISKFYDIFENFIKFDNDINLSEQHFEDIDQFITEVLSLSNIKAFVKKLKAKGDNIKPSKINYRSTNTTRTKLNKTIPPDEDLINNVKQSIKVSEADEISSTGMIGAEGGGFKQEPITYNVSSVNDKPKKTWKKAKRILFKG